MPEVNPAPAPVAAAPAVAPVAPVPAPAPVAAAPAVAPVVEAWAPKIGSFVTFTEMLGAKKDSPFSATFLVTAIGSKTDAKRDPQNKNVVITETVSMPVGATTKMVTRAVMETVKTFDGWMFSAQRQFPEPRRGVTIDALTPLEG